ncbi:glycosyltransferase [Arsenicicoccus piscis]|uniref:glycosyltransferase n=1 Tax=Arsenicicoccus piscis TaxID=673954 RepID=UPI0024098191|nr:glycosyltransferase [Arsenicicoccus piscis]
MRDPWVRHLESATRVRVVLVAVGSRGDAVPFRALARRLVRDGHEAVLVTHARFIGEVSDGVVEVPVHSDPDELLQGPAAQALRRGDLRGLNRSRDLFAAFLEACAAPATAVLPGADVLVASTFAMAAADEALRRSVPVVRAHLWPEGSGATGTLPLLPYSWVLPGAGRRVGRRAQSFIEPLLAGMDGWWERGRLHVVPRRRVGFTTNTAGTMLAVSPTVVAWQGSDAAVTGWWVDADRRTVTAPVAATMADGHDWLYVGFGSMPQASQERLAEMVDWVCSRLGVKAVLQIPGARLSSSESVMLIGHEPHQDLFPRVRAAVHHGGSGTTAAVVRAGVPSVVVPHVADQFYWGHRLHVLGAAPRPLPRPVLTRLSLLRALQQALTSQMATCAGRLGAQVRDEDGTGAAVSFVERAVRG